MVICKAPNCGTATGNLRYILFSLGKVGVAFLLSRTDEKITVGVVESSILHGRVAQIHVYRNALAHLRIAGTA